MHGYRENSNRKFSFCSHISIVNKKMYFMYYHGDIKRNDEKILAFLPEKNYLKDKGRFNNKSVNYHLRPEHFDSQMLFSFFPLCGLRQELLTFFWPLFDLYLLCLSLMDPAFVQLPALLFDCHPVV